MRLRSYLTSLRVVTRRMPLTLHAQTPARQTDTPKHCILLHGWAAEAASLRHIRDRLRDLPQAASWHFWDVTYDSTWTRFADNACRIVESFSRQPHDFSHTMLIGYSMGGLVARQMVAQGFPCRDLITICSPHHGPVRWMPTPTYGPSSISSWSRSLLALNQNPIDAANRHRYRFFAMTYTDILGYHDHDGMVSVHSALGEGLGPVALRCKMHLKYSRLTTFDPHWRGMFPQNIPPVIEDAARLLER